MRLIYTVLFIFFSLTLSTAFSQTDTEWSPVGLAVTGSNNYKGVEMFYKFTQCNGEDACIIKFINNTNNDVQVEWRNALFTNESIWVEDTETVKNQIVSSKSVVSGQCDDENLGFLLKQITDKPEQVVKYRAFSFKVNFVTD